MSYSRGFLAQAGGSFPEEAPPIPKAFAQTLREEFFKDKHKSPAKTDAITVFTTIFENSCQYEIMEPSVFKALLSVFTHTPDLEELRTLGTTIKFSKFYQLYSKSYPTEPNKIIHHILDITERKTGPLGRLLYGTITDSAVFVSLFLREYRNYRTIYFFNSSVDAAAYYHRDFYQYFQERKSLVLLRHGQSLQSEIQRYVQISPNFLAHLFDHLIRFKQVFISKQPSLAPYGQFHSKKEIIDVAEYGQHSFLIYAVNSSIMVIIKSNFQFSTIPRSNFDTHPLKNKLFSSGTTKLVKLHGMKLIFELNESAPEGLELKAAQPVVTYSHPRQIADPNTKFSQLSADISEHPEDYFDMELLQFKDHKAQDRLWAVQANAGRTCHETGENFIEWNKTERVRGIYSYLASIRLALEKGYLPTDLKFKNLCATDSKLLQIIDYIGGTTVTLYKSQIYSDSSEATEISSTYSAKVIGIRLTAQDQLFLMNQLITRKRFSAPNHYTILTRQFVFEMLYTIFFIINAELSSTQVPGIAVSYPDNVQQSLHFCDLGLFHVLVKPDQIISLVRTHAPRELSISLCDILEEYSRDSVTDENNHYEFIRQFLIKLNVAFTALVGGAHLPELLGVSLKDVLSEAWIDDFSRLVAGLPTSPPPGNPQILKL